MSSMSLNAVYCLGYWKVFLLVTLSHVIYKRQRGREIHRQRYRADTVIVTRCYSIAANGHSIFIIAYFVKILFTCKIVTCNVQERERREKKRRTERER